jgi:hypothetical protein
MTGQIGTATTIRLAGIGNGRPVQPRRWLARLLRAVAARQAEDRQQAPTRERFTRPLDVLPAWPAANINDAWRKY